MAYNITGVSFPFRLGSKGGVVMSTTDVNSVEHIEESIIQILQTSKFERTIETHMYSDVRSLTFKTVDESFKTLAKYMIVKALELETRITVSSSDITITEGEGEDSDKVYVLIGYRIPLYGDSIYYLNTEI